MEKNRRYRKLVRQRKVRRQRRIALIALMVFVIMIGNVAFSKNSTVNDGRDVIAVVVQHGDTVWSIANKYKSEGTNLSKYIHEIAANNGIMDGNICAGQTIYVPVEK